MVNYEEKKLGRFDGGTKAKDRRRSLSKMVLLATVFEQLP